MKAQQARKAGECAGEDALRSGLQERRCHRLQKSGPAALKNLAIALLLLAIFSLISRILNCSYIKPDLISASLVNPG